MITTVIMNNLPRAELCAARAMRVGVRNTSTRWGGYQFLDDKPAQPDLNKPAVTEREQPNPAVTAGQELKQLKKKVLQNTPKPSPPTPP